MARPIAAIINPVSGRRTVWPAIRQIEHDLRRAGVSLEVMATERMGHARMLAAQVSAEASALLIVGGDGTVSEVINGLGRRLIPMAIMRTGTENLMAREFGMPNHPQQITQTLLYGEPFDVDLGMLNDKCFAAMVGVGFDAECVRRMTDMRRGHISYLDWFWPIWRTCWSYPFLTLCIDADGHCVFEGRGLAVIGMISRYGGGLRIVPHARCDDGLLDLCIFQCASRVEPLAHVFRVLQQRHLGHPKVFYRQCRNIRIDSSAQVPIQIDGEFGGFLPATCAILTRAARFLRLRAC